MLSILQHSCDYADHGNSPKTSETNQLPDVKTKRLFVTGKYLLTVTVFFLFAFISLYAVLIHLLFQELILSSFSVKFFNAKIIRYICFDALVLCPKFSRQR